MKATQEDLRSWEPCWDEGELSEYLADRPQEFTALDVLDWPDLTAEDLMWVILRREMIPMRILQEFAIDCAEHVPQTDSRSVLALRTVRAYIRGEIRDSAQVADEAAKAYSAAHSACCASGAAYDAARAAHSACCAAYDAARAAYDAHSACCAASSAAYAAARAAYSACGASNAAQAAYSACCAAQAVYGAANAAHSAVAEREWQLSRLRELLSRED